MMLQVLSYSILLPLLVDSLLALNPTTLLSSKLHHVTPPHPTSTTTITRRKNPFIHSQQSTTIASSSSSFSALFLCCQGNNSFLGFLHDCVPPKRQEQIQLGQQQQTAKQQTRICSGTIWPRPPSRRRRLGPSLLTALYATAGADADQNNQQGPSRQNNKKRNAGISHDGSSLQEENNAIRQEQSEEREGIRLNKVFKATHSRRQADDLIASGRVTVNGKPVMNKGGFMVIPFQDVVAVDGIIVKGWETMNSLDKNIPMTKNRTSTRNADEIGTTSMELSNKIGRLESTDRGLVLENVQTDQFEYIKYFKPLGVTCTTDARVRDNIIDAIRKDGFVPRHRVFPVGRLDKETSGLILLTSDGRLVNSVLRGEMKQPKVYKVMVDGRLEDHHLERLRNGVTIRTVAQRKGKSIHENTLVAKTKPCQVERLGPCSCQMTLVEGRNRQIRKMMEAIGFTVVKLHRVEFMGICLGDSESSKGLHRPGDWAYLDADEMNRVKEALYRSSLLGVQNGKIVLQEE